MPNIDLNVGIGETKQLTFNCANTYAPEDIVFSINATSNGNFVVGPAQSNQNNDDNITVFNNQTGNLVTDSGISVKRLWDNEDVSGDIGTRYTVYAKWYIGSDGTWTSGTNNKHCVIPIDDIRYVTVTASSLAAYITFLSSYTPSSGSTSSPVSTYATGYDNRVILTANTTRNFVVPVNAKYLYVYTHTSSNNIIPAHIYLTGIGITEYKGDGTGFVMDDGTVSTINAVSGPPSSNPVDTEDNITVFDNHTGNLVADSKISVKRLWDEVDVAGDIGIETDKKYTSVLGYIGLSSSTGRWVASYRHCVIPIDNSIRMVKVVSQQGKSAYIAFFKTYERVTGQEPDYAVNYVSVNTIPDFYTGTNVIVIPPNTQREYVVPSDAKYLYVYTHSASQQNIEANSLIPAHLYLTGTGITVHKGDGTGFVKNDGTVSTITNVSDTPVATLSGDTLTFKKVSQNTGAQISVTDSNTTLVFNTAPNNTDNKIATMTDVTNAFQVNDAMVFKGTLGTDGTATALPAIHHTGWTYKVITAGNYAGKVCEIGDMIICVTDGTSANNNHWTVVQSNIDGAVTGPVSAVNNCVAVFNQTSGKVIKDSGYTIGTSVPSNAIFTDENVFQSATNEDKWHPILSSQGNCEINGNPSEVTGYACIVKDGTCLINTKTGIISAKGFQIGDGTSSGFILANGDVDGTSYKPMQSIVNSPTVPNSGTTTATEFIATVSQARNGVISATKRRIPTATDSTAGITTVGAAGGAAAYVHTHDYLPLSGGQITGPVYWSDTTALPEETTPEYILCVDPFTNGGMTKYTSVSSLASSHNHNGVYKPVQTAVSSPTASSTTSTTFIDTISQNANGVITATKKTLPAYKPVQTPVTDPTANGTATSFIDTISQDANGEITVTKKNIDWNNSSNYAFKILKPGSSSNSVSAPTVNTTSQTADSNADTLTVTPSNKWIGIGGSATASSDILYIGHTLTLSKGNYGQNADSSLSFGSYFSVPYVVVDEAGHVTDALTIKITLPSLGNTSSTAAAGDHTHTTTISESSANSQITLAHGGKYSITAGGTSYVFTMPSDNNTDIKVKQTAVTDSNNMYPILFSESDSPTSNNDYESKYSASLKGTGSGDIVFDKTDKCRLQFNSTLKCLNFIFE